MNLIRSALALLAFAASLVPASAQAPTLTPADQTAIRAVINNQITAWNLHDMHAYVADMTPDVEWVNVVGMRWVGRDDVFKAHQQYHQTIFKTRTLHPFTTLDIRAITPDVAVVTASGEADGYTTPDGLARPASTSMLTYVLVHRDGRWLITEAHNTTVDPRAAPHNPIQH